MAKAKIKTYDEAVAAQVEGKEAIKDAKKALTAYYKENKLKRSEDYSEGKHAKKIERLEKAVERAQGNLSKANDAVKDLKPATVRRTKYDYPDDIDTPEKRKKYRQAQRADKKPKKEKKKKSSSKEKTSKKKTSKSKGKKKRSSKDD